MTNQSVTHMPTISPHDVLRYHIPRCQSPPTAYTGDLTVDSALWIGRVFRSSLGHGGISYRRASPRQSETNSPRPSCRPTAQTAPMTAPSRRSRAAASAGSWHCKTLRRPFHHRPSFLWAGGRHEGTWRPPRAPSKLYRAIARPDVRGRHPGQLGSRRAWRRWS